MNLDPASYDLYSPYQILTVRPGNPSFLHPILEVNHQYYQRIIDLGPGGSDTPVTLGGFVPIMISRIGLSMSRRMCWLWEAAPATT